MNAKAIETLKTALNIFESIDRYRASESEMIKVDGVKAAIKIAIEELEK